VNQLYWRERALYDAVVRAADRVRSAQAGGAGAEDVRQAMAERREAVGRALKAGERLLGAAGGSAAGATRERVQAILEALAVYGSARPPEANGRLVAGLAPPGIDALPELARTAPAPAAGSPASPSRERPAPAQAALAGRRVLEAEARAAEAELGARRREAAAAASALAEAERRAEGAAGELAEAERRLARARERVAEAAAARERAAAASARAAEALARAERAAEAAKAPSPSS
jgi:hypothetical protein